MTQFFVAAHALVQKDGKFLVTKRKMTDGYMPGLWDLPGGTVEAGETVEDAVVREVAEETGLRIMVHGPRAVYTVRSSLPARQNVNITYDCTWVSGAVVLAEHDEFRWVTLAEAATLPCIHFLEDFLRTQV